MLQEIHKYFESSDSVLQRPRPPPGPPPPVVYFCILKSVRFWTEADNNLPLLVVLHALMGKGWGAGQPPALHTVLAAGQHPSPTP